MTMSSLRVSRSFAKYFVVALIGLVTDYLTLIVTKQLLGANYLVATICGFLVGLTVNYALSQRYVFSDPKIASGGINFALFAAIGGVGLLLLSGLMIVFTGLLGINYLVAKTISTVFVYIWNYFARAQLYHGRK